MKRKGCSPHDSLLSLFDDDESEVSEILLQIPGIIFQSENRNRSLLTWGVRKRRSAIDPELSPPSVPSSSSPYLLRNCVGPTRDDDDRIENAEGCSPVTPLSFPSSESDGRSKQSKTSVSYEMEDLLKMVEELTHRKELLKTKIESIERFYNMVIALNSELKPKKQQLSLCIKTETAETRVKSRVEAHSQPPPPPPLPLPLHHSAFGSEMCGQTSALVPSAAGSGVANFMGPPSIPDLIISSEETLGLDLSCRRISTHSSQGQARKKRLIYRVKKPKGLPQTNQYLKLGVTVTNMVV